VGISGGVEAIVHAVSRVVVQHGQEGEKLFALMDFKNAFNAVSRLKMIEVEREWCPELLPYVFVRYGGAAHMYVGHYVVMPKTGVHQGDRFGPLLFVLAIHPFTSSIQAKFLNLKHAWFLDDGTVVSAATEAAQVLEAVVSEGPDYGIVLNPSKSKVWWPTVDPRPSWSLPAGVGVSREGGSRLLGGFISDSPEYIRAAVMCKVGEVCSAVEQLRLLANP
jgi:Reverse transcriptase (RNA-dependent DNA polymerase)